MPAIQVVLIIASLVLAFGSAGLLAVRLSNPLLRGLGWVGGAFAAGSASAGILLTCKYLPSGFPIGMASLMIMTLFVLVQVAVLEMLEAKSLFPKLGMTLLGIQIVAVICFMARHSGLQARAITTGLLVAAQALQSAIALYRQGDRESRLPARYTAGVLFLFAMVNGVRSLATEFGFVHSAALMHKLITMNFMIYLATVLGVGFGLFWMATTILATGLEHMASTDPLTRIYNRRVFLLWCDRELERSQRSEGPFSILMIDLDRFKQINDRYGHATGDEALCAAVEKMQDSVRGIDVLGRWGGEEFSVLLPHASAEAALLVAERVRAGIARILLPARETRQDEAIEGVRVTASVGIATFEGGSDNVQSMIQRADSCLYRAKATGRNRVVSVMDAGHDAQLVSEYAGDLTAVPDFGRDPLDVALSALSRQTIQ